MGSFSTNEYFLVQYTTSIFVVTFAQKAGEIICALLDECCVMPYMGVKTTLSLGCCKQNGTDSYLVLCSKNEQSSTTPGSRNCYKGAYDDVVVVVGSVLLCLELKHLWFFSNTPIASISFSQKYTIFIHSSYLNQTSAFFG